METVEVRPRIKGLLTKVHFTEGTEVAKGDPLYDIDQRETLTAEKKAIAELEKAKADVLNWKAQIKLAEAELERATLSSKTGVGAKTESRQGHGPARREQGREGRGRGQPRRGRGGASHRPHSAQLHANPRRNRRADQRRRA